jgi:predicted nucleic acid-binding protein
VIENVILDAGPLIALVNPRDRFHEWVRHQFADIRPPLVTCESVISEACFSSRRTRGKVANILGLIERGVVQLPFELRAEFSAVSSLMRRYADSPMSLADACLVRMSELMEDCHVLTLDGDFRVYRRLGRRAIPLLIPPATHVR